MNKGSDKFIAWAIGKN